MSQSQMPKSRAKTAYGLLSEVAALAIEEPKRIRMGTYLAKQGDSRFNSTPPVGIAAWPACGTVGCIAGWVTTLAQTKTDSYSLRAAEALGIDPDQASHLFHDEKLTDANGQGTAKHARSTVRHIRKFQKKYRAQLLAKRLA